MIYRFEVEDSVYASRPVSGEIEWVYTPSRRFAAKGCSLENARRYLGWKPTIGLARAVEDTLDYFLRDFVRDAEVMSHA